MADQESIAPGRTRTVERALDLLAEVAANEGLGLVEVARRVGLSPATALRLLRTLEATGYVVRDGGGAYHGGSYLIQIAVAHMGSVPLYRLAEAHLEQLRDETGETAGLCVPGPGPVALCVRSAESWHAIRHVSWLGQTVPLEGTAVGAALLGQVDSRGSVASRQTLEPDSTAIAAPVYAPSGKITAALGLVGPSFRISAAQLRAYAALTAEHARQLTRELGSPAVPHLAAASGTRATPKRSSGRPAAGNPAAG